MKAEHRHELETNALADQAAKLVAQAKQGQLVSPKVLGGVLAVVLLVGVIWWVLASNRSAASSTWQSFATAMRGGTPPGLEEFTKHNASDTAGKLARLELARIKLGADGISKLAAREGDQRTKAVASIEAAREELKGLADEFKGDKTVQATCLLDAAEAELALVGVAKTAGGSDSRGSVGQAVALIKQAADVVGATTAAGEALLKRAKDLEDNKATVEDVGMKLNSLLAPPPSLVPSDGLGTVPTVPKGPIPTPAPPPVPAPKIPTVQTPPTGAVTPATGR